MNRDCVPLRPVTQRQEVNGPESVQVGGLLTASRRPRPDDSHLTILQGTQSASLPPAQTQESVTASHCVPTASRTQSATASRPPSPYRDGVRDAVASPTGHTTTRDPAAVASLYESVAEALIDEQGWQHATFVATAVRGYVYGSPNPGPYRDEAEAIYNRLGWEQSALLASWFRNSRNWPTGIRSAQPHRPKENTRDIPRGAADSAADRRGPNQGPGHEGATGQPRRRTQGWPGPSAREQAPPAC